MLTLESKNQLNRKVATSLGLGLQAFGKKEQFASKIEDIKTAILLNQTLITFDELRGRPQSFVCWALVNDRTLEKIKSNTGYHLHASEWFEGFNLVIYLAHIAKDNLFEIKREVLNRVNQKLNGEKPQKLLIIHSNEKSNFECNLSHLQNKSPSN